MNITLRRELQEYVNEQVKAGRYGSADQVVEDALARLMLDDADGSPKSEDLAAVREGLEQADRGDVRPWEQVRNELLEKYARKSG